MHHCEGGFAIRCVGSAAGDIDVGVCRAADRDVRIPKRYVTLFGTRHVDLQDDGARRDISDSEAHILDLGHASITRVTNLHDGLWVVGVSEKASNAGDDGPGFSDDASTWRDEEGGFDDVDAIGKVGDLAIGSVGG